MRTFLHLLQSLKECLQSCVKTNMHVKFTDAFWRPCSKHHLKNLLQKWNCQKWEILVLPKGFQSYPIVILSYIFHILEFIFSKSSAAHLLYVGKVLNIGEERLGYRYNKSTIGRQWRLGWGKDKNVFMSLIGPFYICIGLLEPNCLHVQLELISQYVTITIC